MPLWIIQSIIVLLFSTNTVLAEHRLPESLKDWKEWATWDDEHQECPSPYNDSQKAFCSWSSTLALNVQTKSANFSFDVTTYHETWVVLPGGAESWPMNVHANGRVIPVLKNAERPSVKLPSGVHHLNGEFFWNEIPSKLDLPKEIGVLSLVLNGQPVETPNWDAEGHLWFTRAHSEDSDKDFLSIQVYRLVQDSIPMWLHTEIELSVSGKSREEELGWVLPMSWKISSVRSPIPIAIDEQGRMKAQVRAGKWVIQTDAFSTTAVTNFQYAKNAAPLVSQELIAFQACPDLRLVEIRGVPPVDVSMTTFPDKWKQWPVYQWDCKTPFTLEEKMRGMGMQKPQGLHLQRCLWLDSNGKGFTYRDQVTGQLQQLWRLDVADTQHLGSAKIQGTPLLITKNPYTGAEGVEIRSRELNLEAIGRIDHARTFKTVGWSIDADTLNMKLQLPPGWRMLAVSGAERVDGDWVTSWTLLDLFLLMIVTLTMFRILGWQAGLVTLLAFGLSYHEPNALHYGWLFLLVPVVLLQVLPSGKARTLMTIVKWCAVIVLLCDLIPFLIFQVRSAVYPQLENKHAVANICFQSSFFEGEPVAAPGATAERRKDTGDQPAEVPACASSSAGAEKQHQIHDSLDSSIAAFQLSATVAPKSLNRANANLNQAANARIQTGPGIPEWEWNQVVCTWDNPVSPAQTLRLWLIPPAVHRVLNLVEVALLIGMLAMMLHLRETWSTIASRLPKNIQTTATIILLALMLGIPSVSAELPNKEMLETLRQRIIQPPDAFPNAAETALVSMGINNRRVWMDVEIHAAVQTAVPLPGKLPSWTPLTVKLDGKTQVSMRRETGYLWIVVPQGVHQAHVEGFLPDVSEWECSFLQKPRLLRVQSPEWNITGLSPNGIPEGQLFFVKKQKNVSSGRSDYDRHDYHPAVIVDRYIELGLVWKARQSVTRLSATGKAISLKVPLLPGEKVLTPGLVAENGCAEVRLGALEHSFAWESELNTASMLALTAPKNETWVERWHLLSSPLWNVKFSGIEPVYELNEKALSPVWHPWPGETAQLAIDRPEAIAGATTTLHSVHHEIKLGKEQLTSTLTLQVQSSMGDAITVDVGDETADILSLKRNNDRLPVRRDGRQIMIPMTPGQQSVALEWKTVQSLGMMTQITPVRLSTESANISTVIHVPQDRLVIGTSGPRTGPAVLIWSRLLCLAITAWLLGKCPRFPLKFWQWLLLLIGVSQAPLACTGLIIGWFFLLEFRGRESTPFLRWRNLGQIILAGLTIVAIGCLVSVISDGLLGYPDMMIDGNHSDAHQLQWYLPITASVLSTPRVITISIWVYRIMMLAWSLWLAHSLIEWLKWAWQQFSRDGYWKPWPKKAAPAPKPPIIKEI